MARKIRNSALETRSARLKLRVQRKPHTGATLARGVSMLYRRNKGNGAWVVKASNAHGKYWTKAFALADDFDDADGKNVLTYYEAQDQAKALAGGKDGDTDSAPLSVDAALTDYKRDLEARAANPYNADWPRQHLPKSLIAKPVQLLTARELKRWRDSLLGKIAPATINRLCRCLGAALELAATHDDRIKNRQAWGVGLACLPGAQEPRNVILSDDEARAFVANAYMIADDFGLISDVLAATGARPSQAQRLRVGDLLDHPVKPKLSMPKSGKGGDRNRSQKKLERYSIPITAHLAARLRGAIKGRDANEPMLLRSDGNPWDKNPGQQYHHLVAKVVTAIGRNPAEVTAYALRHSSIVRMILRNVPIRIVASLHNTSVAMIEKTYSAHISEYSDDISRTALLQHNEEPALAAGNVVSLAS
jgi:integrase